MSHAISGEQVIERLRWRYATKQFDPRRKISPKDWSVLEDSILLTPSSLGLQPWSAIVVDDPAVREKLLPVAWGQRQVVDASHLVVFAARTDLGEEDANRFAKRIAEVRNVPLETLESYRAMMVGAVKGQDDASRRNWTAHQAYIALGNLLTCAALLGIDACPMEGFQPDKVDDILGLKNLGLHAVAMAPLGYRAETDKYARLAKVRRPKEEVVLHV